MVGKITKIVRLDALWSRAVKKKAGFKCENCDSTDNLQSHHVIHRTKWAVRYKLENGVCLCDKCHVMAHKPERKDLFTAWIETKRDLKYLNSKRNNTTKNDYTAIELYLNNAL